MSSATKLESKTRAGAIAAFEVASAAYVAAFRAFSWETATAEDEAFLEVKRDLVDATLFALDVLVLEPFIEGCLRRHKEGGE